VLSTVLAQGELFPEQITTNQLAQNIVYAVGTVGALSILAGLLLVDMGGVRRGNQFDSTIQKVIGFFIGFVTYFVIGFAIWNFQYNVAFDVANPYWQSIKDWWLGGSLSSALAQETDPAVAPGLNNFQIFIFFLACFAGIINVLIHLAVTERMKAGAFYVISFVSAIVSSILSWLLWGSTGPITNLGFHDFFGSAFVYVFAGAMAYVFARKVGKRPGMYRPHPIAGEHRSYNLGITTTGVVLVFAGLPMVILSCGFFFEPEAQFVGINMAETSIGRAFNNLGLAWAGGALTGALIAYRTRKYIYTLLGPFAGYVAGAPAFDVYEPWQMLLVAAAAPFVAYAVYEWSQKREIDEHKLIPLFLGVASYGILIVGVIKWGTPQSGYFGVEEGDYAYQHAEMNLLWQAVGLGVAIGVGLLTATILAWGLERTIGLTASEEAQVAGFDAADWDIVHDLEPVSVTQHEAPAAAAEAANGESAPARAST
jgi:ammonia channel protein AmtB